jgi:2-oxoglutarate ferredoxin oxidoreductase subunit beta
LQSVSSYFGSLEEPVNPLLYVLAYGGGFVAQATPADMNQLAEIIEEGIRYPGFAFINIQSPCVTYGQPEQQLKEQKKIIQNLATLGHDPTDRIKAMILAQEYGRKLYTGVFYKDPEPSVTYEQLVKERNTILKKDAPAPEQILNLFKP